MWRVFFFILAIIIVACSTNNSSKTESNSRKITEEQMGNEWPFTVQEGVVKCVGPSAVIFIANGKTYAVNGVAISYGKDKGYAAIEEIWKYDESFTQTLLDAGLSKEEAESQKIRISIGPIIDIGLSLCN